MNYSDDVIVNKLHPMLQDISIIHDDNDKIFTYLALLFRPIKWITEQSDAAILD